MKTTTNNNTFNIINIIAQLKENKSNVMDKVRGDKWHCAAAGLDVVYANVHEKERERINDHLAHAN